MIASARGDAAVVARPSVRPGASMSERTGDAIAGDVDSGLAKRGGRRVWGDEAAMPSAMDATCCRKGLFTSLVVFIPGCPYNGSC